MKKTKPKPAPAGKIKASKMNKYPVDLTYIFILLITVIFLFNKVYDDKLFLGGDNVVYYILGKAIALGEGYTNINSPFNTPGTWFPPGYPFISAIIMLIFGMDIEVMNKANGFYLFGSLVFLYLISERLTKSKHLAFAISFITALNMHILNFSIIAMSEIPYIFSSLGAIWFFMKMKKDEMPFRDINFWLFFVLLALTYYIRPNGILLALGVVLELLMGKKWKVSAIVFAGFILVAAPWYIRNKMIGEDRYARIIMKKNVYHPERGDMKTAGDWLSRIGKNAKRYVSMEIPGALLGYTIDKEDIYENPSAKDRKWFMGFLIIALAIAALFLLREHKWLMIFYLSGTAAVLMIFPEVWVGTRLMLIIVPLLYLLCIFAIFRGLLIVFKKSGITEKISLKYVPFIFLVFSFVLFSGIKRLVVNARSPMIGGYERYLELAKWAKANIPSNSVVVCRKPELFYIYSECKTINYKYSVDPDSVLLSMKENKATHVVFDQLGFSTTARYLRPVQKKYPEKFRLIKQLKDPDIYFDEIHYECEYIGEKRNGKKNGKGIVHFADGAVYDGYWKDDMRHGKGIYKAPDGSAYDGEWKNDIKEGKGVYIWKSGSRFEGFFRNDSRNGTGVFYNSQTQQTIDGSWVNDTLNGFAKVYNVNGKLIREGFVKNNKFVAIRNTVKNGK
jgi:hypothetical protein